MYFMIGTFALYILVYQLAYNMETVTGGALGLSGISRTLFANIELTALISFLVVAVIAVLLIIALLRYFKNTSFYKVLVAWAEKPIVLKSLGIKVSRYKLGFIVLSTFLASIAGVFYTFYYLYIDPSSFWFSTLVLSLVIVFLSYRRNEI
jgi:branched-chain amino acid transport system permease protein